MHGCGDSPSLRESCCLVETPSLECAAVIVNQRGTDKKTLSLPALQTSVCSWKPQVFSRRERDHKGLFTSVVLGLSKYSYACHFVTLLNRWRLYFFAPTHRQDTVLKGDIQYVLYQGLYSSKEVVFHSVRTEQPNYCLSVN